MKSILKNILFTGSLILFLVNGIIAQQAQVTVKIDTNRIRIGERAKIELILTYNREQSSKQIEWPDIGDTLRKEIEVIEKTKPEPFNTKNVGNTVQFRQVLTVTSFDSGIWVIPPFKFNLKGDSNSLTESNALLLEVQTVQTDTAEASVKDIKPIFEEQWDWKALLPYFYWGAAIVAILAAAIYLGYYISKNKKKVPAVNIKPSEPAHITALRSLELIRQQKIWTEGKYKEYYTSITDVLRIYIEGRFGVNAMELTTEEILQIFRTQVVDSESKRKLQHILELADFVKFAKATPIDMENEMTINYAFDFVNGTSRTFETETLKMNQS
jgi:hypothetical protein